jgi:hypothetical protein
MARIGTGTLKTMASPSTSVTLRSGQAEIIPCGEWVVMTGPYSLVQFYDPVGQVWRAVGASNNEQVTWITSDGASYRIFNPTGTVIGGVVTNGGTANTAKNGVWAAGSSSTTGVIATTTVGGAAPAGTAQFNVIVGGSISATVTVVTGGVGYVRPPIVTFSNPPPGGLVATGYAVLTAGAVSSIVVTNQGAGYASVPTVTLTNAPGDIGSGATATAAADATNTGKIVAVTMADNGSGYTAVPTVTPSGLAGSPAITAIMCFAVTTAPTVSAASGGANGYQLECVAGLTAGSNTTTNPAYTTGLIGIRNASFAYGTSATFASQIILDGGVSQIDHSNLGVFKIASTGTVAAATTFASGAVGGVTDQSFIIPL